jgi:hypothetical protein
MQTTINIDENLFAEAIKIANVDKDKLFEMALSEFIKHHQAPLKKSKLLDLYGSGGISEDYDYKALRNEGC